MYNERKPHVISSVGSGQPWDAYLYLQASTERTYGGDADEFGMMECSGAVACVVNCKTQNVTSHVLSGPDWMGDLRELATKVFAGMSRVLAVSECARETLAILGFWDAILAGDVMLSKEIGTAKSWEIPADASGTARSVILGAPPTIVRWGLRDYAFTVVHIDTQNHGAKPSKGWRRGAKKWAAGPVPWIMPAEHAVAWLASWVAAVGEWHADYTGALDSVGNLPMRVTGALQAQDLFRSIYMQHAITTHDNDAVLKMERAALYGGRCECLYLGRVYGGNAPADVVIEPPDTVEPVAIGNANGPTGVSLPPAPLRGIREGVGHVWHLDANSLYPAVARDAMLPVRLESVHKNVSVATLIDMADNAAVVADVAVRADEPVVPLRLDGRLVFPVGKFRTTLCGPEIKLVAEHGAICACHTVAVYRHAPIYHKFIGRLWEIREKKIAAGDELLARSIKYLMNAGLARWAKRAKEWLSMPDEVCPWPWHQWTRMDPASGECITWRSFAWHVQREVDMGEPPDSFPAITAYIQSLARVCLWYWMLKAGMEEVLYVDTDSLIVTHVGYDRLVGQNEIDGSQLGALKVVEHANHAEIMGQRCYQIGERLVTGCNDACRTELGDTFAVNVQSPPIGYYLQRHNAPGFNLVSVRKRLRREYRAGNVHVDGRVTPIVCQ
jgi:hypothetical protein